MNTVSISDVFQQLSILNYGVVRSEAMNVVLRVFASEIRGEIWIVVKPVIRCAIAPSCFSLNLAGSQTAIR